MMVSGTTSLLQYWVAARPIPGQSESGDQFLVQPFPDGVLIAVIDGLGHGVEAAAAAKMAVAKLAEHAGEPVVALVQRCHAALRKMRGAVMSIASCNGVENTMTWIGVGNVEGMLVHAAATAGKPASLLVRGGIVGDRLPTLLSATVPLRRGDLLFFATDGIQSAFLRELRYTEHPHELVHRIFMQHGKSTDDVLLLAARWNHDAFAEQLKPQTATTGP